MAKIDTSKITGYAEMSAEDKLKALEAFEYEDNAAELEKQKAAVSKANSEAAEWKRKHNALLGEDEKKKQEQEEKFANMEKSFPSCGKPSVFPSSRPSSSLRAMTRLLPRIPQRRWLMVTLPRCLPTSRSSLTSIQNRSRLTL